MRKDPTEFRKRFLAWKSGLLVYDKGRPTELPKYEDGIVGSIKNAILGASIAEDPAIMYASGFSYDKNGNVVQTPTETSNNLAGNLGVISTMSPTHPLNVIVNGALGFLSKGVKPAVRMTKPVLLELIVVPNKPANNIQSSLTTEDYHNWIKGVNKEELADRMPIYLFPTEYKVDPKTVKSIQNSVTPRLINARPFDNPADIERRVNSVLNRTYEEFPTEAYLLAGKGDASGIHNPTNDFISIKNGKVDLALQHELRHSIDDAVFLTKEEAAMLKEAYNKHFPKDVERVTTNRDVMRALIGDDAYTNLPWKDQNKLVDSKTDTEIIKALRSANGYGNLYFLALKKQYGLMPQKIINAIRRSLKYVGVSSTIAPVTNKKENNRE